MGLIYGLTGEYSIGLMLLSDVAFAALVFTWLAFRTVKETLVRYFEDRARGQFGVHNIDIL